MYSFLYVMIGVSSFIFSKNEKQKTVRCSANILISNDMGGNDVFINIPVPYKLDLQSHTVPMLLGYPNSPQGKYQSPNQVLITELQDYIDLYLSFPKEHALQLELIEVFRVKGLSTLQGQIYKVCLQFQSENGTFATLQADKYEVIRNNRKILSTTPILKIEIQDLDEQSIVNYSLEYCGQEQSENFYIILSNNAKHKKNYLSDYENNEEELKHAKCKSYKIPIKYEQENVCKYIKKEYFEELDESKKNNIYQKNNHSSMEESLRSRDKLILVLVTAAFLVLGVFIFAIIYICWFKKSSEHYIEAFKKLKIL